MVSYVMFRLSETKLFRLLKTQTYQVLTNSSKCCYSHLALQDQRLNESNHRSQMCYFWFNIYFISASDYLYIHNHRRRNADLDHSCANICIYLLLRRKYVRASLYFIKLLSHILKSKLYRAFPLTEFNSALFLMQAALTLP